MRSELIVFLASMTPFVELKLAVPLGLELGLSQTSTLLFTTAGTMIPASIGLAVAEPVSEWMRKKSQFIDHSFEKLFEKTRSDHSKNFERYGPLLILFFVAIPLPGSGASMGALIAFLFDVDYWRAISMITIGTIIAGILLITGFSSIFKLLELLAG